MFIKNSGYKERIFMAPVSFSQTNFTVDINYYLVAIDSR